MTTQTPAEQHKNGKPGNPWAEFAGIFANDPNWSRYLAEVKRLRSQGNAMQKQVGGIEPPVS